ncbi:alpha/beta fold hydrolase [Agromyces archimandritae]|uniref:Alpha/beta hydrolase n=1 Tax=Agromyces archimandritae TaxID=2781962 RepID=A0A975IPQ5_9MICO|nr:alpha/beta hydrolase [Agromyces archimandritae]QTX05888.1 alpha/beta hydrolase [Agromyces archimandritae]
MTEHTATSADGTAIAYTATGDGEPIVIVDGATAYRAITAEDAEISRLLADGFRVISYDRRGRGGSGDTAPYAVEREFEDLAAVIEHGGGGRPATVFAWSSGGNLALNAVQAGAVPVARLALFEPNALVDDALRPPFPDDYTERLEQAVADGRPGDAVTTFLTVAVGLPEDMVAGIRSDTEGWAVLEAIAPTLAYDARNVGDAMSGRPLAADRWNRVDVPVLVMHGADTWPVMAAGARAVAEHVPTATLQLVPGENHSADAEVLAGALRDFIRSTPGEA